MSFTLNRTLRSLMSIIEHIPAATKKSGDKEKTHVPNKEGYSIKTRGGKILWIGVREVMLLLRLDAFANNLFSSGEMPAHTGFRQFRIFSSESVQDLRVLINGFLNPANMQCFHT